jgi:alpha-methylacyl-CoA racemase
MTLANLGANVLRIARPKGKPLPNPVLDRGRAGTIELDLKSEAGRLRLLELIDKADALIEGYRPGVMERLQLGPESCLERNKKLIYGRITGWGRSGPLANHAGHDINYIALTGALHAVGTAASGPLPPLNLVGDFGGGGMLLALGIACGLVEAQRSGKGQVVDAAMIDGSTMLMSMMFGMRATNRWPAHRAGNIFDGSAYFYTCYACADGEWMAVGAIEPEFRKQFFDGLGLSAEAEVLMKTAADDSTLRARIEAIFRSKTRAQWQSIFEATDACVTPVLSMTEAPQHPHNQAWGSFRTIENVVQPAVAPRFSRTPPCAAADWAAEQDGLRAAWGLEK